MFLKVFHWNESLVTISSLRDTQQSELHLTFHSLTAHVLNGKAAPGAPKFSQNMSELRKY